MFKISFLLYLFYYQQLKICFKGKKAAVKEKVQDQPRTRKFYRYNTNNESAVEQQMT